MTVKDFRKIKSLSLINPIEIPGQNETNHLKFDIIVKNDKYNRIQENDFKITAITYFSNGSALGSISEGFSVSTSVGKVIIPLHNVSSIAYEKEQ